MPEKLTEWGVRIVACLLVFLAVFFAARSIRTAYEEREQFKQQLAAEKARADDYQRRTLEANNLAEKRAESAERIRAVTKEIVREVPIRIPADACPLPDAWRVLVDAAAQGQRPAAPGGADAAGPAAADPAR